MAFQIEVASPCSEPWDAMRGDERSRFCQRCELHVFNFGALTEAELQALVVERQGKVCGRFFRRRDGTVLTRDCPTGVRQRRVRLVKGLLTAAGLLCGLAGWRVAPSQQARAISPDTTFFTRASVTIEARVIEAREALRETQLLGPLVDRFFPAPPPVMGRISSIQLIRGDR